MKVIARRHTHMQQEQHFVRMKLGPRRGALSGSGSVERVTAYWTLVEGKDEHCCEFTLAAGPGLQAVSIVEGGNVASSRCA
jgi:hypothetical protein